MRSAFGVEHKISKGLPRFLKDVAPGIEASGTQRFRGGSFTKKDYPYLRVRANQHGKRAGRLNREWEQMPKTLENGNIARAEAKRQEVQIAAGQGQLSREASRRAIK